MLIDPFAPNAASDAAQQSPVLAGRGPLISVLALVRGQPMLRLGLQACLATEPSLQWLEPVINLSQLSPDVVLIDADAPAGESLVELATMQQLQPFVPVVVLQGMPAERGIHLHRLAARAACVVDKRATPRQLICAIQAVHRGQRGVQPAHEPAKADPSPLPRLLPKPGYDLTKRERDLLKLLATGISNRKIAAKMNISLATTKFHVTNVLAKLGTENRTAAVLSALRHGLLEGL